ncbi:MAG TPA: folate-binding protein [Usitatibacter sp.]|nr:folate-binding protein [Usitatibacter sp.]
MSSPDSTATDARARDGAIVAELSHNALLSITGDDATAFLHGQFTNDVEALRPGTAQWNGWCSPKGRLLATFLLVRHADGYLLMLPAEIAAAISKRLAMFVLRSRVTITDVTDRFARLGLVQIGVRPQFAVPGGMRVEERDGAIHVALDSARTLILAPNEVAQRAREALGARATPAGADAWERASISAGIPTIVAATQDAFVPQMANFELVGGVSFRKGCYPGQEIVARTQYRGILKRRMALAHVRSATRPAPGQSLYSDAFGDQAAGTVVNAAPAPGGGWDLLAVAQLESLRAADLHLDSPSGTPLEIRAYPAPEAAS